jgi:holliday junction DNA helicase RuvA
MYNFIIGKIAEKNENIVVVENNGIGYELNVSINTLETIGNLGDEVKLYTYLSVREDDMSLFGFSLKEEKNLFLNLISVSGVGPKSAIQILSGEKLSKINIAISNGDTSMLSKIKGIGKKTAERIIVELKDKVMAQGTLFDYQHVNDVLSSNSVISDTVEVLISLGLSKVEAQRVTSLVYKEGDKAEDVVTKALQSLGR